MVVGLTKTGITISAPPDTRSVFGKLQRNQVAIPEADWTKNKFLTFYHDKQSYLRTDLPGAPQQ